MGRTLEFGPTMILAIYSFNAIPIKIPMTFFTELEQIILEFMWNHKTLRITKAILGEKKQSWRYNPCRLQTTIQSYSNQNSVYWHKNRQTDQWNRTESSEIDPHIYGQLTSKTKEARIYNGENIVFNKWCWKSWTTTCKRMKLEHSLTPYTKNKLKMD